MLPAVSRSGVAGGCASAYSHSNSAREGHLTPTPLQATTAARFPGRLAAAARRPAAARCCNLRRHGRSVVPRAEPEVLHVVLDLSPLDKLELFSMLLLAFTIAAEWGVWRRAAIDKEEQD